MRHGHLVIMRDRTEICQNKQRHRQRRAAPGHGAGSASAGSATAHLRRVARPGRRRCDARRMAAVASHLADTSALARLHRPAVAAILGPLIEAGLVATCGLIEFEIGWATRNNTQFDPVRADREEGYESLATHH